MGKLRHQAERAAFGKVIDSAMKHINKDREKSFLKMVDLTESFAKDRFHRKVMMRQGGSSGTRMENG